MKAREGDRRDFLIAGATAGASALLTACGWSGGPLNQPATAFSRVNDGVSGLLFSRRLAKEYPVASRTPGTHFPSYYVSDGTPMLMDPVAWRLQVGCLVRQPASTAWTRSWPCRA